MWWVALRDITVILQSAIKKKFHFAGTICVVNKLTNNVTLTLGNIIPPTKKRDVSQSPYSVNPTALSQAWIGASGDITQFDVVNLLGFELGILPGNVSYYPPHPLTAFSLFSPSNHYILRSCALSHSTVAKAQHLQYFCLVLSGYCFYSSISYTFISFLTFIFDQIANAHRNWEN
jgi:hypothetical protein